MKPSKSNASAYAPGQSRTRRKKGANPSRGRDDIEKASTPVFNQQVARVHKFLELASKDTPREGPPVFRQTQSGTLEQVGREADNAWAGVKKIFQLLNTEGKVLDSQVSTSGSWAGSIINLTTGITQGAGDSQRNGDSLKVTRIRGKIGIFWSNFDSSVVIVLGRSKDGIPAIGDVFDTTGTTYSQLSFENHDQRKADQWLWHRTVASTSDKKLHVVEFDLKHLEVPTTYLNGTATSTSGTYWFAVISGSGTSAGTVVSNIRMNFVDN